MHAYQSDCGLLLWDYRLVVCMTFEPVVITYLELPAPCRGKGDPFARVLEHIGCVTHVPVARVCDRVQGMPMLIRRCREVIQIQQAPLQDAALYVAVMCVDSSRHSCALPHRRRPKVQSPLFTLATLQQQHVKAVRV